MTTMMPFTDTDFVYDLELECLKRRINFCLKEVDFENKEERIETLADNIHTYWDEMMTTLNSTDLKLPKPDDFYISYRGGRNRQFCMELYDEGTLCIDFYCDTDDAFIDTVVETIEDGDNIIYVEPNHILTCLKQRYKMTTSIEIEHQEPGEDVLQFECSSCPVCMEDFDNPDEIKHRRPTFCGHSLCYECFENVANSDNLVCPICRADYQNTDIVCYEHHLETDVNDIIMLQNDGEPDNILKRINTEDLAIELIRNDGYKTIMEIEWENWDSGNIAFGVFRLV